MDARSHTSHISFMRLQKNERKINFIAHQTSASGFGGQAEVKEILMFQNITHRKSPQFFASSPSHLVHSECLAQLLSSLEIINTGWAWCCVWDSLLFIFFLLFFRQHHRNCLFFDDVMTMVMEERNRYFFLFDAVETPSKFRLNSRRSHKSALMYVAVWNGAARY